MRSRPYRSNTCDFALIADHTIRVEGGPVAKWMIGRDETSGAFVALYADTRGVCRIYQMSFAGDVWRIWREIPRFHQRFMGRIGRDRRSIQARWERSDDGTTWDTDFDLQYTKAESNALKTR